MYDGQQDSGDGYDYSYAVDYGCNQWQCVWLWYGYVECNVYFWNDTLVYGSYGWEFDCYGNELYDGCTECDDGILCRCSVWW